MIEGKWTLPYYCPDCHQSFVKPKYGTICPHCGGRNWYKREEE